MNVKVWLNHRPVENISFALSAVDRGLQYGDGFFTTCLIDQGRLLNWKMHVQRLKKSVQALGFPVMDWDAIAEQLKQQYQSLALSNADQMVCKLIITRGEGGRGYRSPSQPGVQQLSYWMPAPVKTLAPLRVNLSSVVMATSSSLAGLKHLNRLDNVLASSRLPDGVSESLLLNAFGQLQCGSQSNLFLIRNGQLCTPPVDTAGVAGTLRATLIDALDIHQSPLTLTDLRAAEGAFLTNAVRGIQPISTVDLANWSALCTQMNQPAVPDCLHLPRPPAGKTVHRFTTELPVFSQLEATLQEKQWQNALEL